MKTSPMMSLVYGLGNLLSVSPWILYILNPIPDKPDRENARSLTSNMGINSVILVMNLSFYHQGHWRCMLDL